MGWWRGFRGFGNGFNYENKCLNYMRYCCEPLSSQNNMKRCFLIFIGTLLVFISDGQTKKKLPPHFFLNDSLLGKSPYQNNTETCLGWAVLYGLFSHEKNKLNHKDSLRFFNPYFNYELSQCTVGIYIQKLEKSIQERGLLYEKDLKYSCGDNTGSNELGKTLYQKNDLELAVKYISLQNRLDIDDLKEHLSKNNRGFVVCYSSKLNHNLYTPFQNKFIFQTFDASENNYNHAIFCIGYDDTLNGGAFLFRDSDWMGKHQGNIWITYKEFLKDGIVDYIIKVNQEIARNIKFTSDDTLISGKKFGGNLEGNTWWLSKSYKFLSMRRFYYNEHFNKAFRISVLKLTSLPLGRTATIAILDANKNNKPLYSFKIRPGESNIFTVNHQSYKFEYINKTWGKGKKHRAEVNYNISPYTEQIIYK
jgi:hypothetical protein